MNTPTPNMRPPSWRATPATLAVALARAAWLDRQSDLLLSEGRRAQAERLAHLAHAAREQAQEARP